MKYKKIQIIHTTVADVDITDVDVQKELLTLLCESDVDIILDWLDPQTEHTHHYARTRIRSVGEDTVDLLIFNKGGTFRKNKLSIKNIVLIKLVTDQKNIIVGQEDTNRFDFINFAD